MAETRINQVNAIIGKRGTGKTFHTRQLIDFYERKQPNMKRLVVDTFDHPMYKDIQRISIEHLPRWKSGTYRIFESDLEPVFSALEEITNIVVFFEDATKYINKVIQKPIRRYIFDSKQKNADLFFLFHGFSSMPPELTRIINNLILFKSDNPAYRRSELAGYEEIYETWLKVMKDPNPYAKRTICLQ